MIEEIPCVILCGGKSSRMKEDKSLLPFGSCDTLIEYQYKKLSQLFKKVYISTKENKFNFDATLIYDNCTNIASPMIALQSIFKALDNKTIFIITVDSPLLLDSTIYNLIESSTNHLITIAKDKERTHNLCGVFKSKITPLIDKLVKDNIHKINHLIRETNNFNIICFENEEQFININTPNDYKKGLYISKTNS